jgi:hypothetical protein
MIPKLVGHGGVAPPTQSCGLFDSSETVLCRQLLSWAATALSKSAGRPHLQAPPVEDLCGGAGEVTVDAGDELLVGFGGEVGPDRHHDPVGNELVGRGVLRSGLLLIIQIVLDAGGAVLI